MKTAEAPSPKLNAKHTMRVFTKVRVGSIWSLGGTPQVKLIAAQIEVEGPYDLGKGYSGFIATSPTGETFVVERTTGGFVGGSLEEVRKDVKKARADVLRRQMEKQKEVAATATLYKPWNFWKYL